LISVVNEMTTTTIKGIRYAKYWWFWEYNRNSFNLGAVLYHESDECWLDIFLGHYSLRVGR